MTTCGGKVAGRELDRVFTLAPAALDFASRSDAPQLESSFRAHAEPVIGRAFARPVGVPRDDD
jgi:hypothetical protein